MTTDLAEFDNLYYFRYTDVRQLQKLHGTD
jgi:hypothetical protein